ncbi:MAG: ABC transporter permease [Burkholderiaceae bacterium]|jgi:putative ABC transport system permease protein|nr:ABC transporter permease [Burkholderiaceae bacterium]
MNAIHLDLVDLVAAAVLVVASAAASVALSLQVHRALLWAAARMVVQLLLIGLLLRVVLTSGSAWATALVVLAMMAAAAREVAVRPARRLRHGLANYRIGAMVVGASSVAVVGLALLTALRPAPWYDPRYTIPLMGIVLGTVLNSASLALDSFYGGLEASRSAIEARLALGATLREALAPLALVSLRRGLIPLINQMSAAGIITLPGIMTGQLLAGMDPVEAAKYQILLLLLMAGGGCLASGAAIHLACLHVGDGRQRLRLDRLQGK